MTEFLAGVAVRDITPPPGAPLWGYSNRTGPATGTLDPLYAKAAVFRAGGQAAAVVAVDLGRVPAAPVLERIRRRAADAGVDYVFVTATHTHHAPVMETPDAPYMPGIEEGIGAAVEAAAAAVQPARFGIGRTCIDIAHNRRIVEDGRCEMLWRNVERRPTGPLDPEATLIRLDTAAGEPLAVLVHFACHPVVMGDSNLQYSADYPGETARLVRERSGLECLFLQGACGNLNPYLDKTPLDADGVEVMRATGRECAEAVVRAAGAIHTAAPATPSVLFGETLVDVGWRWDLADAENRRILAKAYGALYEPYVAHAGPELTVPVSVVVLNREAALAGMPGEVFVQFQDELKRNAPLRNTLLCGYTNGYYAYFPTVRDAVAGGYGGTEASFAGVGAGDKLTLAAKLEIARLLGALRATCREDDFDVYRRRNGG